MHRPQLNRGILERWLFFAIFASIIFLVFSILIGFWPDLKSLLLKTFAPLHPWLQTAGIVAGGSFIAFSFLSFWPFRWNHFRFLHRYPPMWLAALLALVTVFGFDRARLLRPPSSVLETGEWAGLLGVLLASFAIAGSMKWFSSWVKHSNDTDIEEKDSAGTTAPASLPHDFESLKDWLQEEKPSTTDRLNRLALVRRFARLLRKPLGKEDKTLGLIGSFGSGKSSIIGLVRKEIESSPGEPDVWFCNVSCWGFEDSGSANHYILKNVISTIEEHVECSSLRQLPDIYRKVLTAAGGKGGPLVDVLFGQVDPVEKLGRISTIMDAVNARLVVLVEDLDRNQSSKFDPKDVMALLQRLKSVRGVSFILTGASTLDFAKLCDHIEAVPQLDEKVVLEQITILRNHCLNAYGDVNPAIWYGKDSIWDGGSSRELAYWSLGHDMIPFSRAALALLTTPRTLKHALCQTLFTWENLHGEIDFDDLLVVNTLYHGAPGAFNFLLKSIEFLRASPQNWTGTSQNEQNEQNEKRKKVMVELWARETTGSNWNERAAKNLITFLIPNASTYLIDTNPYSQGKRPQGVEHVVHVDYWNRMLAGEVSSGEVRDQEVLRAMDEWLAKPLAESALVQRLASDERFANGWVHFADRVQGRKFLELADQVFQTVITRLGPKASDQHLGVHALRRRARNQGMDDERNGEWLGEMVRVCLPRSLALCIYLYEWAHPTMSFVKMEDRKHLRETIVDAAKQVFTEANPQALIDAIDEDVPYLVYQLVFPPDNEVRPSVLQAPKDWQWFAPVLLAAAKIDQKRIIPQLAHLISTRKEYERGVTRLSIAPDLVSEMFGDKARDLMDYLTKILEVIPDTEAFRYGLLGDEAHQWLSQDAVSQTHGTIP